MVIRRMNFILNCTNLSSVSTISIKRMILGHLLPRVHKNKTNSIDLFVYSHK